MTTGLITCFDTITNSEFPAGAAAYAGYVDGHLEDQPNYAHIVNAYPHAEHLSITLTGADADCADVEPGAMTASQVPGWYKRQVARGIDRPVIYASAFNMKTQILPLLAAHGIARTKVRLLTAHYGYKGGAHICGPGTCGQLPIDADGTQWTQNYQGRNLDASLLAADFFGSPATKAFDKVGDLTFRPGKESVALSWRSPLNPAPWPVKTYEIAICEGKTLGDVYQSYPRTVLKDANAAVTWQGGSLKPGTWYTAGVRALAQAVPAGEAIPPNPEHAGPWATVTFQTT